jgi:hypothetical protein
MKDKYTPLDIKYDKIKGILQNEILGMSLK